MRIRRGQTVWLGVAAGVAAAVIAVVVWAPWQRPVTAPASHARQYLNASACLLTDRNGIVAGSAAAPVWATMRSASLATHVMVSYLPAAGPSDVTPMLNTLVQRRCGVIITTPDTAGQAVATAAAHPGQRFLLITTAAVTAPSNADVVSAADAPARITAAIDTVAAHATGS